MIDLNQKVNRLTFRMRRTQIMMNSWLFRMHHAQVKGRNSCGNLEEIYNSNFIENSRVKVATVFKLNQLKWLS